MRFEAQKHSRVKYGFIGVSLKNHWYVNGIGWAKTEEIPTVHKGFSNHFYPVRSIRAFRRRLKKWPIGEYRLLSRWVGSDVFANKITQP